MADGREKTMHSVAAFEMITCGVIGLAEVVGRVARGGREQMERMAVVSGSMASIAATIEQTSNTSHESDQVADQLRHAGEEIAERAARFIC